MTGQTVIASALAFCLLASCTDPKEFPPTYTIARKGVFLTEENFDVANVYGFSDNREVARQISEFLNKKEPDTYFYHVNQSGR